jgi:hypothetical protein
MFHYLGCRQVSAGGDIEKIADVIKPTFRTRTAKFWYFSNTMNVKHMMALESDGS